MSDKAIVLYHYSYSPYARRVVWYLALRRIPYSQCLQPPLMPRPDLGKLGIRYRRIPVLAIGRDIYLDTRLMLRKLEELIPSSFRPSSGVRPRLGATAPDQVVTERLLESFTTDTGLFDNAFQLIPTDLPLLRDPAYYADRADFMGMTAGELAPESLRRGRPAAMVEIRRAFDLFEHVIFADGRDWVLGNGAAGGGGRTDQGGRGGPSLADIDAVWPFHWLTGMKGALPSEFLSAATHPRVFSWVARFQQAVSEAKRSAADKPMTLSGDDAVAAVLASPWHEPSAMMMVDDEDPVLLAEGLRAGDAVMLFPTDTGSGHKDIGKLLSLTPTEIVIETRAEDMAGSTIRLHAPRHGFQVCKVVSSEPKL